MYGALAVGAPLGSSISTRLGFAGMSCAAALAPLAGLAVVALVPMVRQQPGAARLPVHRVIGLIWLPGLGLMLSAVGFGAIAAFSTLRFAQAGWPHAALAMTAFGAAYVAARLLFGRFPDKVGGARVAIASTAAATLGQASMWLATSGAMAVAAAALTGLGFSLAFPSFGVEAIRRVPPHNRGAALGAYTACFDAAMGLGVLLLGAVVGAFGSGAAFGVGALTGFGSLSIAVVLWSRGRRNRP